VLTRFALLPLSKLVSPARRPSRVSLARAREIRTLGSPCNELGHGFFTYLSCTKRTKYEALENTAVSTPKTLQVANLQYSSYSRKARLCWGISNPSIARAVLGAK
jgi:hypothetical protein